METRRTISSCGVFCLLAAALAIAACESKAPVTPTQPPPVDPDPKPTSVVPLAYTVHTISDSTIALEYSVVDTVPFDTAFVGLESFTSHETFPILSYAGGFGPIFEVKKRVFSPPRYSVHVTDTLPARTMSRNWLWAVILRKTNGAYSDFRYTRSYIGPRELTLVTGSVPAQALQQPALDLLLQSNGPAPVRAMRIYVDSGTGQERSYGPTPYDSAKFKSTDLNLFWHVWVTDPLQNGSHTLTVTARDSLGNRASTIQRFEVAMPTPAYRVRVIDVPGAIETRAEGLNTSGTVVGTYRTPDTIMHAFRWAAEQLDSLPSVGPSRAGLVNDAGLVIGLQRTGTADSLVAWRSFARIALAPSRLNASLNAVNDHGDVLYDYFFIYRNGVVTRSPIFYTFGMNNMGTLVGVDYFGRDGLDTGSGFDGSLFGVYPPGPPFFAPTNSDYYGARFVNDKNQIVGSSTTAPAAYLFEKGKASYWAVNPFGLGQVFGMSRWTLVLGRLTDGRIAIWQIGGGVTLPALDSDAWTIDELRGINENGQIIAHGVNKVTGRKVALFLDPR